LDGVFQGTLLAEEVEGEIALSVEYINFRT